MSSLEFLMLLGVAVASAVGQLLLRRAAIRWNTGNGLVVFTGTFLRSEAVPALLLVLGAPFLYWKALETVSLSQAYAVMALTGVLIQFGAVIGLKEKTSFRTVAGALMCCAGIAVWGI